MFTLFCYLFALVPTVIGVILWLMNKRVVLWEVLLVTVVCFATAASFNYFAIKGMTDDVQTFSGRVCNATYQPPWLEYYEYAVYRTEYYNVTVTHTDSKGRSHTSTERRSRQVFDHWEPSTRNHGPEWSATDTLIGSYGIQQPRFEDIKTKFGGVVEPHAGSRTTGSHNSRMISGDPMDYTTVNKTSHVYPVTTIKEWENKVKAAPSLFSFHKVAPGVPVFEYPKNDDHFTSDRLLGTAAGVSQYKWDQLNADLGPSKKVNMIACGFADADMGLAQEQEAAWIGGKKNDLVICFGGQSTKPKWVYCFGWTEQDLVKRNIETLVLNKGLTDATLPELNQIVVKDYTIKDWKKFDYLTVEVPFSKYIWLIVCVTLAGGGLIAFAMLNGIDKEGSDGGDAQVDWREYNRRYNR
jgi:hypothetical protein